MLLFSEMIAELEKAVSAASYKRASFGFPTDRVVIKCMQFGGGTEGHVGGVVHPDKYIKRMTELYRETWAIPPIRRVIDLLKLHAETIHRAERLVELLRMVDVDALDTQLRRLASVAGELSGGVVE